LKQWIEMTKYYRAKREYEPDAAQPAQEPEQEPVAWMNPHGGVSLQLFNNLGENSYTIPLCTTPQQRNWVNLTDEERDAITDKVIGFNSCCGWEDDYAKAIEAKLKELNQ
jgi:hypothetical protein